MPKERFALDLDGPLLARVRENFPRGTLTGAVEEFLRSVLTAQAHNPTIHYDILSGRAEIEFKWPGKTL